MPHNSSSIKHTPLATKDLNGLVLAGGFSQRMQQDKALLCYYKKPQYVHVYHLLSPFCNQVFISCKSEKNYPLACIFDSDNYLSMGPIAGLLSAFDYSHTAWLVVAIDYPLFSTAEIEKLLNERDNYYLATVYCHSESDFFEPYLAIYEKDFLTVLKEEITKGNYSLQQILKNNHVKKVFPTKEESITSVDTIEDFNKIYHAIH